MKRLTTRNIHMALTQPTGLTSLLPDINESSDVYEADNIEHALAKFYKGTPEETLKDIFQKEHPNQPIAFALVNEDSILVVGEQGHTVSNMVFDQKEIISMQDNPADGLRTLERYINDLHYQFNNSQPEDIINNDLKRRTESVRRQRQVKLKQLPPVPDDFWEAIEHMANWSSCYDEFKALFKHSMFDLSDRNLTRLGRATVALNFPNKENNEEVTVYRALPTGYLIEEGDWITTQQDYAEIHLQKCLNNQGINLAENVRADEIYDTGDPNEQVYIPKDTWKNFDSLKEIWDSYNVTNKPTNYPEIKARTLDEITKSSSSTIDL